MGVFHTTRWSLIVAAGEGQPDAHAALDELCRAYRPAVLAYVRGHGYARDDAEDLTQGFFARLIEKRVHSAADPARGRFRVFLRTALHNYLANSIEFASAARRRSARPPVELDPDALSDGTDPNAPERAFERAWALTVVTRALERLRQEARDTGKGDLFARLRGFLLEPPEPNDYARIAAELGTRSNTIAVATHRLRQRLQELVREEVAHTVADIEDVDDEYTTTVGALRSQRA